MQTDSEVLAWVREAVANADSWSAIESALRAHDPEGNDERLRPFVFAFGYRLHEAFSSGRESAGGLFGSQIASEGWQFLPALRDAAVHAGLQPQPLLGEHGRVSDLD